MHKGEGKIILAIWRSYASTMFILVGIELKKFTYRYYSQVSDFISKNIESNDLTYLIFSLYNYHYSTSLFER